MIRAETEFRVEFYDVDSMNVAWHGNYVKFLELGRCALLDKIGYGYQEMNESGIAWPVVDLRIKYIKPLSFQQTARITADLLEYEHRIRIRYLISDRDSGEKTTTAETIQMAVDINTGESLFAAPAVLIQRVEALIRPESFR